MVVGGVFPCLTCDGGGLMVGIMTGAEAGAEGMW